MKISFDLDGVVSDGDSNMLGVLHQQVISGVPNGEVRLKHYYLSRKVVMNPLDFMAEGDEIHIITGRSKATHEWTKKWLLRWLTGATLHFSCSDDTEYLFSQGEYDKASKIMGQNKLKVIKEIGADIHFDNNPLIINALREAGVKAILVGRQII